jgi:cyclase
VRARRLVVCLDVRAGRVVKGVNFEGLRDVGDPVELAARYEDAGADELVFLDVSASLEERRALYDVVERTAERLFIPLTVGGGMRTVTDVADALRAGADKVSINSAALTDPGLLTAASDRFGAQCVVLAIDAKRAQTHGSEARWLVHTHGGKRATDRDAVAWAREGVSRGAGEILLTSMDRDGVRGGYDLALTRAVAEAVNVPVIASGGAGSGAHLTDAVREGKADAVLVAGILHDGVTTVGALKECMASNGIFVRSVA